MIVGGIIQALMGVEAARRDLEDIAPPLSATGEELEEPGEAADPFTVGPGQGRKQPAAGTPRFEREGTPASQQAPDAERDPATRTRPTGGGQ